MKRNDSAAYKEDRPRKSWIGRLLDWLARGHQKAVESGKYCPT